MKRSYTKMAIGVYATYFLLGMINIILASNMSSLATRLQVDRTDVSLLISAVGIGHLLTIQLSGKLSDRFGRKPLIMASMVFYSAFLGLLPLTTSFYMALALSFLAGMSNSLLDSGAYPALNEAFPNKASTASVLLKAFISTGAALLPLMVAFLMANDLFFGYAFFVPAFLFILLFLFLAKARFPKFKAGAFDHYLVEYNEVTYPFSVKPKMKREGLVIVLIGFVSISLLIVVQTWLPTYGEQVLRLSNAQAVGLLSYLSIGGLTSVILLALLLNNLLKPATAMVVYPAMSAVLLFLFLINPFEGLTAVLAFFLGLFMSGIFQLAVAMMVKLFPENKGTSTAYVSAAASVAFILIPYGTGLLAKYVNISAVFVFDIGLASINALLAIYIYRRHKIVTGK